MIPVLILSIVVNDFNKTAYSIIPVDVPSILTTERPATYPTFQS